MIIRPHSIFRYVFCVLLLFVLSALVAQEKVSINVYDNFGRKLEEELVETSELDDQYQTVFSDEKVAFTQKTSEIGYHYNKQCPIEITEYEFPQRIYKYYIDSILQTITFQLRDDNGKKYKKKGQVVQFDLLCEMILWNLDVNYQASEIIQVDGTLISVSRGNNFCLEPLSGIPLWKVDRRIFIADRYSNVAMGYGSAIPGTSEETLDGFDLTTGELLWKREVSRDFGWRKFFYLNDTTIIIAGKGIQSIHPRTGKGWGYQTFEERYSSNDPYSNDKIDYVDNLAYDSLYFYYETQLHLTKIRKKDGFSIWTKRLKKDPNASSVLLHDDENVYLLNAGNKKFGNKVNGIGHPYFIAYSKDRGREVFNTTIESRKGGEMRDYMYKDSLFIVMYDYKFDSYSLKNGEKVSSVPFKRSSYGELARFFTYNAFIENGDSITPLFAHDTTQLYVWTQSNKNIKLDSALQVVGTFPDESLYHLSFAYDSLLFLSQQDSMTVINASGKTIAKFDNSYKLQLMQGKLYGVNENSLYVIDLNTIRDEE